MSRRLPGCGKPEVKDTWKKVPRPWGPVDAAADIHRSNCWTNSRIAGLPSNSRYSHIEATSGQLEPSRSELAQSLMFEWELESGAGGLRLKLAHKLGEASSQLQLLQF